MLDKLKEIKLADSDKQQKSQLQALQTLISAELRQAAGDSQQPEGSQYLPPVMGSAQNDAAWMMDQSNAAAQQLLDESLKQMRLHLAADRSRHSGHR